MPYNHSHFHSYFSYFYGLADGLLRAIRLLLSAMHLSGRFLLSQVAKVRLSWYKCPASEEDLHLPKVSRHSLVMTRGIDTHPTSMTNGARTNLQRCECGYLNFSSDIEIVLVAELYN